MKQSEFVKDLGALRDGLLVCSSVIYLLGYLTWSIYAWRRQLGPVSVLDAQYFAAGLPIAIGLLFTYGSVIALRHVVNTRWPKFIERLSDRWRIATGLTLLMAAMYFLVRHTGSLRLSKEFDFSVIKLLEWAGLAITYSLMAFAVAAMPVIYRIDRVISKVTQIASSVVLALFGIVCIAYFAGTVYPTIPASLGGGLPRSVALDIQTSNMAPETLRMLLAPNTEIRPATVVRTHEVALITAPGPYYLIEIPSLRAGSPPSHIQLERSAVVAIMWTK